MLEVYVTEFFRLKKYAIQVNERTIELMKQSIVFVEGLDSRNSRFFIVMKR